MENKIIIALATAPMTAALAVIRVSGEGSIELINKMFTKDISNVSGYSLNYGYIKNSRTGEHIDEVLLSVFRNPRSYTGEDMVEISCHGGMFIVNKIIQEAISLGAVLAQKGEFTKRAYLNGKIDLIQAESIHDMITATSEANVELSLNNIEGKASKTIEMLLDDVTDIRVGIEVNIDYPEYDDAEVMTHDILKIKMSDVRNKMLNVIKNGNVGKTIKDGVNVALVGKPNVGKSSLLNLLINEEKAIVTDIAGTTRDVVEGKMNLDGIMLNLYDTAGIRDTFDVVEQLGVVKSKEKIENADLVILMLDGSKAMDYEDHALLDLTKDKKRIVVVNKSELKIYHEFPEEALRISVRNRDISVLIEKIKETVGINLEEYKNTPMLTNARQLGLMEKSLAHLDLAIKANEENVPVDLIAIDLQDCYYSLQDVLGKRVKDGIIDSIFSKFCLGK